MPKRYSFHNKESFILLKENAQDTRGKSRKDMAMANRDRSIFLINKLNKQLCSEPLEKQYEKKRKDHDENEKVEIGHCHLQKHNFYKSTL